MKQINSHQKSLYEKYDLAGSKRYFDHYVPHLERFSRKRNIKILDIGGASGFFAYLLKEYFDQLGGAEVYVVDSTEYDSWAESALGGYIHFIHDSVENLDTLFAENSFDIVFANRVFHHFVDKTYSKTLSGMDRSIAMIHRILKEDGLLCIMDHFYDGMLIDSAASRLIYLYTSIKNPFLASLVKKLGAMTAGVGVCFQSEKMWIRRVEKGNFQIEGIERTARDNLHPLKRIGLLCKGMSRNNLILATPKK